MRNFKTINLFLSFVVLLSVSVFAISEQEVRQIADAMPSKPVVQPAAPRTMLVFSLCNGFKHSSVPYWSKTLDVMSQKTGAFKVVHSSDMSVFTAESLKRFDVICLNNTTKLLPDSDQQKAILDFIKSGKGIVGIHAATDNFYEWPAGMEMMGGVFKGHPWTSNGTWAVKIDEPEHPLMTSFKGKNFKIKDEIYRTEAPLYSRENQRVLMSLDMSDPTTKNAKGVRPDDMDTGITWIKPVGKGRLFYCSLGHEHAVTWNSAVLGHFLAGIQYAMGDLKVDDRVVFADEKVGMLIEQVKKYDWAASRAPLIQLQNLIQSKLDDVQATQGIERKLLDALASDMSLAAKDFVCRELSIMGTEASIPVLSKMLMDPETSNLARYAMERIPGDAVDAALIKQLGKTDDKTIQIGIITSLGVRRCDAAVGSIADFAMEKKQEVALAAIQALGAIGTKKAGDALGQLDVEKGLLKDRLLDAQLACAGTLAGNADKSFAQMIYGKLYREGYSSEIQAAALTGLIRVSPLQAKLLIPQAIKGDDIIVQTAALTILATTEDVWLLKASSASLGTLSDDAQIRLIAALSENPKKVGREQVEKAASSENMTVRIAAYRGLTNLGDADSVELLARAIAGASDRVEASAAKNALYRISAKGVNEAILSGITSDLDEKVRVEMIRAAEVRQIDGATKVFFKTAYSDSRKISSESIRGLQSLGKAGDVPQMLDLMIAKPGTSTENAMVVVAGKINDQDKRAAAIIAKYPSVDDLKAKVVMLRVMGKLGDRHSIALLRKEYRSSSDEKISQGAFRAMMDWPGSDFVAEMKQLAKTGKDTKTKVLAFRAYVRMLTASKAGEGQIVDDLIAAFEMTDQASGQQLVISALGDFDTEKSLVFLQKAYTDSQFKAEVEVSLVNVCEKSWSRDPSAVKSILRTVIDDTQNESVKQRAKAVLDQIKSATGFILDWEVSGIYKVKGKGGNDLFDIAFDPEKNASSGKWQKADKLVSSNMPGVYDLTKLKNDSHCAVYFRRNLQSDKEKETILEIGSDDAVKVWVNGELVLANNAARALVPGQDKVQVKLKKGNNSILVKVIQKSGGWAFCMQIND